MSDRYNPGDPYPKSPLWSSGARVHLTDADGNRITPPPLAPIDPEDVQWMDGDTPDADGRCLSEIERHPDREADA